MTPAEFLISKVPDPDAACRFLVQLKEKHSAHETKLRANPALLADVLMLVACSPLFATTLLHEPEHITWLERERKDASVRDTRLLLESLARFAMTHSLLEPHVMLARFRRRELMRIFLKDVRRLAAIAEITDEISNLADAVMEHALRISKQELDNRFGQPQESDGRGRIKPAEFCIVSLGKLGSKELNYSSDIDLLFIFSGNGKTSDGGSRGTISNLEYFSKLTESIIKLIGGQGGEGAAYRVDLRLRPYGRVGPLALPLKDTIRYYASEAAAWERQVLIRARPSAGSGRIFDHFFESVKSSVFSTNVSIEGALQNVAQSKKRIDLQNRGEIGTDIKLGTGGIREIEFISQAMQLAFGGHDEWLRAPHTLVSLDRLAERGHLTGKELTELFGAYEFLRRLEHILQIENGLQTHTVPNDPEKRSAVAARMNTSPKMLKDSLRAHTSNVHRVFNRIFYERTRAVIVGDDLSSVIQKTVIGEVDDEKSNEIAIAINRFAPRFNSIANAHLKSLESIRVDEELPRRNYLEILSNAVAAGDDFGSKLRELRKCWYRQLIEIVAFDAPGKLSLFECKLTQTRLAEASIEVAFQISKQEVVRRFGSEATEIPVAILGLGKLGSGGLDYDSDLDLVFAYSETKATKTDRGQTSLELLTRLVETFTNVLSSITRDGSLYRVDLRLRRHGNDGPLIASSNSLAEYFSREAAIWEMLAFVKLRAVGGDVDFGAPAASEIRATIHERTLQIEPSELANETRSIRSRLEQQKAGRKGSRDLDIKYGEGGLLDVYFAIRYLQLRNNIRDETSDRSTLETLNRLSVVESLNAQPFTLDSLRDGYEFLAALDHNIRLTIGRTSRIPIANHHVLEVIADRMHLASRNELLERLNLHRLAIRSAFESIVGTN